MVYWELICQQKHTQLIKDSIRKDNKIVDCDYQFRYKVMLN